MILLEYTLETTNIDNPIPTDFVFSDGKETTYEECLHLSGITTPKLTLCKKGFAHGYLKSICINQLLIKDLQAITPLFDSRHLIDIRLQEQAAHPNAYIHVTRLVLSEQHAHMDKPVFCYQFQPEQIKDKLEFFPPTK